jgi:hypothetical protein
MRYSLAADNAGASFSPSLARQHPRHLRIAREFLVGFDWPYHGDRLAVASHDFRFSLCRFDSFAPAHSASRLAHLCRSIPIGFIHQPHAGTSRTLPSFQMIMGKPRRRSSTRFLRVARRCACDAMRASGDISLSGIGFNPLCRFFFMEGEERSNGFQCDSFWFERRSAARDFVGVQETNYADTR